MLDFLSCLSLQSKSIGHPTSEPIHGPVCGWVFHSLTICFTNICCNIFILDDTSEGSDYSEENDSQEEEDNSRPRAVDLKLPKLIFTDEVEGAGFKSAVSFAATKMHVFFFYFLNFCGIDYVV